MANDFSLLPTWVHPDEPEFNVAVSQTENLKKDYQTVDTSALYRAKLVFTGISDADMKTIRDHFIAVKGTYAAFAWKNAYIPAWIKTLFGITTADITGHWVAGSFSATPRSRCWDVEISIEW